MMKYPNICTKLRKAGKTDEQYDRLCRQSVQEIEEFSKKLDDESRKSFDALLEHYLELTYIEKSQTFCDGFRLGAGIMCEVFKGKECLCR